MSVWLGNCTSYQREVLSARQYFGRTRLRAGRFRLDRHFAYVEIAMEKQFIKWSFWLGSLCAVLAAVARILDVLGSDALNFSTKGSEIGYHTFMNGSFFFYLFSIAVSNYFYFNANRNSSSSENQLKKD
jgi:hypothetical protein